MFGTAFFIALWAGNLLAQTYTGSDASKIIENSNKLILNQSDGKVQYCSFENPIAFDEKAIDYIKQTLGMRGDEGLVQISEQTDGLGFTHIKYQQVYKSVRVETTALTFHLKETELISFSGSYGDGFQLSITPTISQSEAVKIGRTLVETDEYRPAEIPQLVVYPTDESYKLAFKVDVFGLSPIQRKFVFVDANSGAILASQDRIHEVESEGEAETRYSGNRTIITDSTAAGFRLHDNTRGGGIVTLDLDGSTFYGSASELYDSDNYWEEDDHSDDAALDAHWGTEVTYDYFFDVHGRDSYDNEGSSLTSYVDYDNNYSNAFWNGEAMTYGAGDVGHNPFPSLDVVAHEICHGVTEYSAGLIYANESGALNESFSDIFGIVIDFYARGDEYANYEMGEEILPAPIRSMANPNLFESPDTYLGDFWITGNFDNGGVHFNSGVQNYWFYLLSEGGSGVNDNDDAYYVEGIGMDDAAAIAYRNLTVYLTPSSQYADAREFSIQSAIDLYGECSDQVIAVTNAWQAVGVGSSFDNAVIAAIGYSGNYYCQTPASVFFTSLSSNAVSYVWDFGDGTTSTDQNPTHIYTEIGEYTVTLAVAGDALCSSADTSEYLITITDSGGPVSPSCAPVPITPSSVSGISSFSLGDIANSSGASDEGYEDFTCTHTLELMAGSFQTATAQLYNSSFLKLWLDINNDGSFSESELVYASLESSTAHEVDFLVPATDVYNEPLRLRVMSTLNESAGPCAIGNIGQVEDYSVTILENETSPIADFSTEDQTVQLTSTVAFTDFSLNLPYSWEWYFEGGVPQTSTEQNPAVQYNETGTFAVSLIVTNDFGADTLLISDYISVVNAVSMCDNASTTATTGILYDSGGPDGNYENSEFCTFLISPPCAQSVTISFEEFQLEGCCDNFRVYDGSDDSAPLLLSTSGSTIPNDVTAESGEMFIRFSSDGSVTYSGWAVSWNSETPSDNPVADFSVSDETPPLSTPVQFTDATTDFPASWIWDFGDGSQSFEQNPTHSFESAGVYTVSLIVENCFGADTTTTSISVQDAPSINVIPSTSIELTMGCGTTVDTTFHIFNSGEGDLVVNPSVDYFSAGYPTLLALTAYTNVFEYGNTLNAINSHLTNYELLESEAQTAAELTEALANVDILLIPEQNIPVFNSFFANISPAVLEFVSNGGGLIICANYPIESLGIFPPSSPLILSNDDLQTTGDEHPVLENVETEFMSPLNSIGNDWSGFEEIVSLVNGVYFPNYSVVAKREYGSGTAIYCGFDYFQNEDNADLLLANSVFYLSNAHQSLFVDSLSMQEGEIIYPGDSLEVFVSLSAEDVLAGNHTETIYFETNDPINPLDSLQILLEVTGQSVLSFQPELIEFDDLIAGFSATDTVIVNNDGCADLELELTLDHEAFNLMGASSLTIPPFSSDTILVSFSPVTPGEHTGSLALSGTGGDGEVYLSGVGLDAPEMELIPSDTLFVTVPCGSTSEDVFTIQNNGAGDLEVDISQQADGELNVLSLITFVDFSREYPNTLDAINQYFSDYTLTEFTGYDIELLEEALADADILLIPEQENSSAGSYNTTISSALNTYLENGGLALICGSPYISEMGIFQGTFIDAYIDGVTQNTSLDHPIMTDAAEEFGVANATFSYNFESDTEATSLAEVYSSPIIAEKNVGNGKAVYIGFDFYEYDDVHAGIIGNAMEYLGSFSESLEMDTEFPIVISPSGSTDITVFTDAEGLLAGDYFDDLVFYTNDPVNTIVNYVVAVEVTGEPLMETSTNEVVFPTIFAGQSAIDTLVIFNEGCVDLTLDASLPSGFFSISTSALTVAPFASDTIFVAYEPTESGSHTELLSIESNGGNSSVQLTGQANASPVINYSPENPSAIAESCADSVLVSFDVSNTGEGLLEFEVGTQAQIPLEDALADLAENYPSLTDLIPNIHYFSGGENGNSITDGGGDMYDGGNYLSTNVTGNNIPYTGSEIIETTLFGDNSSYFTTKTPGLFVMAADINSLQEFRIEGNLGADGSGMNQGNELNYSYGGVNYKGFATRTSSTYDPTINHLIVLKDKPGLEHSFLTTTFYENHIVSGLNNSNRIYYLLFSSQSTSPVSIETMLAVFETFVEDFIHSTEFAGDSLYEVEPGESVTVEVYIPIAGLDQGVYEFPVQIASNDPVNPVVTVPVVMEIDGAPCPYFEAIIDDASCSGIVEFDNLSTNNPDEIEWDFGDGSTSQEESPVHTYTEAGIYEVTLTVCSAGECFTHVQTVEITGTDGPIVSSCQPSVENPDTSHFIESVSLDGETNVTGPSETGYEDFSCEVFANLTVGSSYALELSTSTFLSSFVRVELDYNGDGVFSGNEIVSQTQIEGVDLIIFDVPPGAMMNEPLRLRVLMDQSSISGCDLLWGEVQDYAVVINPLEESPVSAFSWEALDECQRVYQFYDQSSNFPNSWGWDFGDGNTSSAQNPIHIFEEAGTYDVSLTSANVYGNHTSQEEMQVASSGLTGIDVTGVPEVGQALSFSVVSDGTGFYTWNFGDGNTMISTAPNVQHTFSEAGVYEILVTTNDDVCENSVSIFLYIQTLSTHSNSVEKFFAIYPNPSQGEFAVKALSSGRGVESISLLDAVGKQVGTVTTKMSSELINITIADPVAGMYILEITTADGEVFRTRVILE